MKINIGCGRYVGLTDVRLHRVFVRNPRIGVSLTPGR